MTSNILGACAALLLAGCASTPAATAPATAIGRLYHYVRTNSDGSSPENIYVYRASATRVEVGKIVARCSNAAYVTADFDAAQRQADTFVGGRIAQDGSQAPFAWLDFDPALRDLHARVPDFGVDSHLTVGPAPWLLYDFDLADLTTTISGQPAPHETFSFSVVLIWPDGVSDNPLRNLGEAQARFESSAEGVSRFRVSGALNGVLALDAHQGHVVEATFAEPNHLEYRDFQLRLLSIEEDAADAWQAIREDQWRGCS